MKNCVQLSTSNCQAFEKKVIIATDLLLRQKIGAGADPNFVLPSAKKAELRAAPAPQHCSRGCPLSGSSVIRHLYASLSLPTLALGSRNSGGGDPNTSLSRSNELSCLKNVKNGLITLTSYKVAVSREFLPLHFISRSTNPSESVKYLLRLLFNSQIRFH